MSWATRAAAFSPSSGEPLRGRAQDDVGDLGDRRGRVVGERDRARAASAGELQGLDDGGGLAGMGEGDGDVAFRQEGGRHQHHVRVVEDAGAHADAQELVRHVSRDLGRAADAVEVALARREDEVGGALEGVRVEDRERLLERVDRGAEDLLGDLGAGVVGRELLVEVGGRQAVVVRDAGPELLEAGEAELLGDLDEHGVGHAGILRHGAQRRRLVEVAPPEDHLDDARLERRQLRHHHADPRADGPRITDTHIHPRPWSRDRSASRRG